jgi:hypothetical protein
MEWECIENSPTRSGPLTRNIDLRVFPAKLAKTGRLTGRRGFGVMKSMGI